MAFLRAWCSAALCSAATAVQHGGSEILEGEGGEPCRGALASGGITNKIFLYNKLPT